MQYVVCVICFSSMAFSLGSYELLFVYLGLWAGLGPPCGLPFRDPWLFLVKRAVNVALFFVVGYLLSLS